MPETNQKDKGVEEAVRDTLFNGKMVCWQYRTGYRFSIDSVLLAHFADIRTGETILDLGTGTGVLGLILFYRHSQKRLTCTGYEKQTSLLDLATRNICENEVKDRFRLVAGPVEEIRDKIAPEAYSLVISNPPYYQAHSGRTSSNPEAREARHQSDSGIQAFAEAAAYSVRNKGHVVFVYPAERSAELMYSMKMMRLEPKRIQFVYSYPDRRKPATLLLLDCVKNGGTGLKVLPPCYIYQKKDGPYTPAVAAMYHS